MDYGSVNVTLTFAECQNRSCVDVLIEDDDVLELTESFSVTLERTLGLDDRIELGPVDAEVEITDNDGMLYYSTKVYVPDNILPYSGCGWSGGDSV